MKVAVIEVKRTGEGDPLEFAVIVRVGDGETRHHVTMVRDTCERLTAGTHTPERCIEAAFEFLLDREPKESILRRFDVTVISRYFAARLSTKPLPTGSATITKMTGIVRVCCSIDAVGGVFGLMKPGNGAGFPPRTTWGRNREDERGREDTTRDMGTQLRRLWFGPCFTSGVSGRGPLGYVCAKLHVQHAI
jgi:hypothetical protein